MMSNMKNLLGDMDFEEFLAKRELVLEKVSSMDLNGFYDISCDIVGMFYDYWLEIGGRCIANERVRKQYGGVITTIEELDEYTQYLVERFVDWLKSF